MSGAQKIDRSTERRECRGRMRASERRMMKKKIDTGMELVRWGMRGTERERERNRIKFKGIQRNEAKHIVAMNKRQKPTKECF